MDYYEAGFAGYLDGKSYSDVMRELAINVHSHRNAKEIQTIIAGWHEASQLDRATTPTEAA